MQHTQLKNKASTAQTEPIQPRKENKDKGTVIFTLISESGEIRKINI